MWKLVGGVLLPQFKAIFVVHPPPNPNPDLMTECLKNNWTREDTPPSELSRLAYASEDKEVVLYPSIPMSGF